MKKTLSICLLLVITIINLFALKLPTGDNVRALDVKEDRNTIVEVKLGGDEPVEITTPIGKLLAKNGTTVSFYKSGALKSICFSEDNNKIETPIGTISLIGKPDYYSVNYYSEFYETGSPKRLLLERGNTIIVGENTFIIFQSIIKFYDSGSKDKWLVKEISLPDENSFYYNGDDTISFQNKLGSFTIIPFSVVFFKNGMIKKAYLYESPKEPISIKDNEVYIKGVLDDYAGHFYKKYAWIEFYENETIKSFVSDEVCLTNQGGLKLNIPAGSRITLYKNGNIQKCTTSNENTVTIKSKSYNVKEGTYLFNENGSIKGFSASVKDVYDYYGIADTFYNDGSIKRLINNYDKYSNYMDYYGDKSYFYTSYFCNPKEKLVTLSRNNSGSYAYYNYSYYYLQKGDEDKNVAMIFFDDKGIPSSYTLFKLDEDGDYLLDEMGYPIEDTTKKTFVKK